MIATLKAFLYLGKATMDPMSASILRKTNCLPSDGWEPVQHIHFRRHLRGDRTWRDHLSSPGGRILLANLKGRNVDITSAVFQQSTMDMTL